MRKKFSWKVFISFGLTYSFLIIFISGLMLYTSPPGRYAHWVEWKLLGFTKEGWQALHIIFSFTFAILSVFHLFTINWQSFLSYLKSKKRNGVNKTREFFWSTILTLIFFFGIIFSVPPFKYVTDFGEYLTESWEQTEEKAPIPHAELLTLTELAEELEYSSVDEITRKLDTHEIKYENTNVQTLQEIAHLNGSTPIKIYGQITQKGGSSISRGSDRQGGQGRGQGSSGNSGGSGIGRKTIDNFAVDEGLSIEEVLLILKENNIEAKKGQTLRDIGENNNIEARDIHDFFEK
ncbi:MAG: DUF4405 domain-containing protein [Prolixibacteraceae bacterium]|jgi:hypothetical protein|nr:DUF4405 domain-containing protein [Prolixibacteraceae bacterium]MBT6004293.1 DUF4405 domain-containing protein [Prolixibacteraceae bacterium]MBT6767332.1 DUF4405 domain-containing protein [Prolixibacteraceae bacterium]MBT7000130.1 DUF4405 domain-containing protein [Prolixibacteraceae bacterium]MBT7397338.1 DUF4405 domain-containing protein [Prolixibacteraceae bacterium]